jgi:uncharacterized membrane protein SpoIIM required for sporulation
MTTASTTMRRSKRGLLSAAGGTGADGRGADVRGAGVRAVGGTGVGRKGLSSVKEPVFVAARKPTWDALDDLIGKLERLGNKRGLPSTELAQLSPLYRDAAADLARAESSDYSEALLQYLQDLTARGHGLLYRQPGKAEAVRQGASKTSWFVLFPQTIRRHHRAMWLATALFFVPLLFGLIATLLNPRFAAEIAGEDQLQQLAEGYAKGFSEGRGGGEGAMMAGFYVHNNVGIALRCFAVGVFGGIGSAFYLLHNGLVIGATLGYVTVRGAGLNILTFIVGHGTFELGAIVIAGGAGMVLGWSFVAPGPYTRVESLRRIGRDAVVLIGGAAVMLLIAALLEGFWSGSSLPSALKLAVGALFFVAILAYIALAGRSSASKHTSQPAAPRSITAAEATFGTTTVGKGTR